MTTTTASSQQDCYFFMMAQCLKQGCSFRHSEKAKATSQICPEFSSKKTCSNPDCELRHSEFHIPKPSVNKAEIPCYYESHGGCQNFYCPFMHTKKLIPASHLGAHTIDEFSPLSKTIVSNVQCFKTSPTTATSFAAACPPAPAVRSSMKWVAGVSSKINSNPTTITSPSAAVSENRLDIQKETRTAKKTGIIKLVRNNSNKEDETLKGIKVKSFEEIMREKREKKKIHNQGPLDKVENSSFAKNVETEFKVKTLDEIKREKMKLEIHKLEKTTEAKHRTSSTSENGKPVTAPISSQLLIKEKPSFPYKENVSPPKRKTTDPVPQLEVKKQRPVSEDTTVHQEYSSAVDLLDDDDDLKQMLGITTEFNGMEGTADVDMSNFENELLEL